MGKGHIFISYSHADESWATEFARSLRERGVEVWLDREKIRPGELVRDALEQAFRESSSIILLVSPENVNRPDLLFEIGAAIALGKPVLPVISKDVDIAAVPQPLRIRRYLVRESPQATAQQFVSEAMTQ